MNYKLHTFRFTGKPSEQDEDYMGIELITEGTSKNIELISDDIIHIYYPGGIFKIEGNLDGSFNIIDVNDMEEYFNF